MKRKNPRGAGGAAGWISHRHMRRGAPKMGLTECTRSSEAAHAGRGKRKKPKGKGRGREEKRVRKAQRGLCGRHGSGMPAA